MSVPISRFSPLLLWVFSASHSLARPVLSEGGRGCSRRSGKGGPDCHPGFLIHSASEDLGGVSGSPTSRQELVPREGLCGPCLQAAADVGSFGPSHLSLTLGPCAHTPASSWAPATLSAACVCGGVCVCVWGCVWVCMCVWCMVLYNRCSPSLGPLALWRKTQALVLTFRLLRSPPASLGPHLCTQMKCFTLRLPLLPHSLFSRARDRHTAIHSHRSRLPL